MQPDKNILVLFYDRKDMKREIRGQSTLEDEVKRGFGEGVKYHIRTASPRHEPFLVQTFMNGYRPDKNGTLVDESVRYDGMIIVGGLSCSLDIPNLMMQDLYDKPEIEIAPRDWKNTTFIETDKDGKPLKTYKINLHGVMKSKYHLALPIPIIGVPTQDPSTDGEIALGSMMMSSRPSEAACVGIDQTYQAARLMSRIMKNTWNNVSIIIPHDYPGDDRNVGYKICSSVCKQLDAKFEAYKDDRIGYGPKAFADFMRHMDEEEPSDQTLHVLVYDTFGKLKQADNAVDFLVAIYAPYTSKDIQIEKDGKKDFVRVEEPEKTPIDSLFVKETSGLEHTIHSRTSIGENAGVFIARCLYVSHPKLKAAHWEDKRRERSWPNIKSAMGIE